MSADVLRAKSVRWLAGPVMRRLRASRVAAILSAFLLLLQVVATADHLSAQAFAAGSGQSGAGGFLDVCRSPRPAGVPGADTSVPEAPEVCPACAVAAAAAGGIIAVTPVLSAPLSFVMIQPAMPQADLADPKPWRPYGSTRGPPLA